MKPIAAIIAAIASLSCCIPFMTPAEAEERKIVFHMVNRKHNGSDDIFCIDTDGENLQNLTNHPAGDHSPAPSPNGKYIAFTSWRNGKPDLFIMNSDGKNPTLLVSSIGLDRSCWSPDSKWIAFGNIGGLFVININGGEPKKIFDPIWAANGVSVKFPSWSPDGKKIAFRVLNADRDIYTINADGTNLRQLTKGPETDDFPTWSPDGRQIAFSSGRDEGGIFVMDRDGANEKQIYKNRKACCPSWSLDGKIAFSLESGIFVMNSDGRNVKEIFNLFKEEQISSGMPSWLEQRFFNIESEGRWKTHWGKMKRNF